MSTTSPNFGLVLATSADVVAVDSHIANNFSTLDRVLAVSHTGTGQLKNSLSFTTPVLINPTVSGTIAGLTIIAANTGVFNTITATGGALTVNSLSIGTYALPTTVGATGALLTVVTGNAVFVAPSGGTGANTGLSNLASVAINTSLNTFSAGFVTVDRVIATSGALTGLTAFQATAGTFAGLLTALGTVTANVVNCTGGAITAGGVTVGTYALPSVIGAASSIFRVLGGTATFAAPLMVTTPAAVIWHTGSVSFDNVATTFIPDTPLFNPGNAYSTVTGLYTAPSSGTYRVSCTLITSHNSGSGPFSITISVGTGSFNFGSATAGTASPPVMPFMGSLTSGGTIGLTMTGAGACSYRTGSYITIQRLNEF